MTAPCLLLDLTRRYCEPHRHYHTLEHIADMLFSGRDLALDDVQIYAIWYHDAIYDPHSVTNEEDSAVLATESLRSIGWDEARIERAARMVLDTKKHEPTIPGSADVMDLDLSSIAADWEVYERNRENIRREYAWIPEDEFAAGTREFLQKFLARERIFTTKWGEKLEAKARENMQRALAAMS
jgi:predicted metal-dependent HD superfamily phosphohydrolase